MAEAWSPLTHPLTCSYVVVVTAGEVGPGRHRLNAVPVPRHHVGDLPRHEVPTLSFQILGEPRLSLVCLLPGPNRLFFLSSLFPFWCCLAFH